MELSGIQMAREYKQFIGKIDSSIQILTAELDILKRLDVMLLKKFIHINEEIQNLQNRRRACRRGSFDMSRNTLEHTVEPSNISIMRRQSLPYFYRVQRIDTLCSTASSLEDLSEVPDDESPMVYSDDKDTIFKFPGTLLSDALAPSLRYRSLSCAVDISNCGRIDDTELETILLQNVELWKSSNGITTGEILAGTASTPSIVISQIE